MPAAVGSRWRTSRGRSVRCWRNKESSTKSKRYVVTDIAKGLLHADSKGVVHRDIKPSNVLITDDGAAKLADFGIAWIQDWSSVGTQMFLGSPPYVSPEQIERRTLPDFKSDMYSLGVVLFELLTGARPFTGTDPEMLEKHREEKPPSRA
jgi:serine/threonine protein kinase